MKISMVRRTDGLGRIALPGELRCALGLGEGASVRLTLEGRRVVMEKETPPKACGCRAKTRSVPSASGRSERFKPPSLSHRGPLLVKSLLSVQRVSFDMLTAPHVKAPLKMAFRPNSKALFCAVFSVKRACGGYRDAHTGNCSKCLVKKEIFLQPLDGDRKAGYNVFGNVPYI